jgi:hypothetical protein
LNALILPGAILLVIAPYRTALADVNSLWQNNDNNNSWNDANNWNPAEVPNNGNGSNNYDAEIPASAGTAVVNSNFTIDDLTVDADGTVDIGNGFIFQLDGGTQVDNGVIYIGNPPNSGNQTQFIIEGGTFSGNGTITLVDNGNPNTARLDGSLTLGSSLTIDGHGNINASVINNGTIVADVGSTSLNINGSGTNNGFIGADADTTLTINSATITQSTGSISAAGGTIDLSNAVIIGGTLNSSSGGAFFASGTGTFSGLTNDASITLVNGNVLNIAGNLTDDGTILVSGTNGNLTQLIVNGGTVSGTGFFTLDDNGNGNAARLDGSLTQGSSHTIDGHGNLNASVINSGTIVADVGSTSLNINGSGTNNGFIGADTGATLSIGSVTLTQSTGSISAAGGTISLSNATIVGGTLNSGSGGGFFSQGTGTLSSLTNDASITILNGSTLEITSTITDNGTILVSGSNGNQTQLIVNGGTVSGTGFFTLDDNGNANSARLDGSFTQGAGHTIDGHGNINASVINEGTIVADVGSTTLHINGSGTNNGFIGADTGATLSISSATITQSTGSISAAGGTISLSSATIVGGTLNSSSGGGFFSQGTGTLSSLTNDASITILNGTTLNIASTITDNGTILVSGTNGNPTSLTVNGGTVSGTGFFTLDDNGNGNTARLDGSFTQGADHTIDGHGNINASVINDGTIDANVAASTLSLVSTSSGTNNGVLESTDGTLAIANGITITQGPGGHIDAIGGVVAMSNETISGGTLNSGSGGFVQSGGTGTIEDLVNNAAINILQSAVLNAGSTITNNGTITVNDTQFPNETQFVFSGGTLSGTGVVVLNDNGNGNTSRLDGSLTLGSSQTIEGHGNINAQVINDGTIDANVASTTLTLNEGTITNNGLIESTAGNLVTANGVFIDQTGGGSMLASGNSIGLTNATVSGGTLNSAGTNGFLVSGTGTLSSLTNNADVVLQNGGSLEVTGNLTDNGTILVSGTNGNQTQLIVNGGTVSGTGFFTLDDNGNGNSARLDGSLTQGAGHSIDGHGNINASVINDGIIDADVASTTLTITGTFTNDGVLEASNGGTLTITTGNITQGVGGEIDAAGGTVVFQNSPTITGGTINGSGDGLVLLLSGTGSFTNVTNNTAVDAVGGTELDVDSTLTDNGTITINSNQGLDTTGITFAGGTLNGTGVLVLDDDASNTTATINGSLTQGASHTVAGQGQINAAVINNGTFDANVDSHTLTVAGTFTNDGVMQASNGGTLLVNLGELTNQSGLTLSGGTYEVDTNSTINMVGAAFTTNAANIIINGASTSFAAIAPLNTNSGLFHLENGASFNAALGISNSGTVLVDSTSDLGLPLGAFSQSSGLTQVDGTLTTSTFNLTGGTLKGTGDIATTVDNTGGTINPGDSPGELTVGSFSQGSGGTLDVEIAGTGTGQFDVLAVLGSAQLGGTVDVIPLNGFVPQPGETFTFLTAGSLSGEFASLSAPPGYALNYTSNSVFLTVPEPASFSLLAAATGLLATRRRHCRRQTAATTKV